jgi:hypothetical protein
LRCVFRYCSYSRPSHRLKGQCLNRRIESSDRLVAEIDAWQTQRNQSGARINWMFSTDKARTKMARAYPDPSLKDS